MPHPRDASFRRLARPLCWLALLALPALGDDRPPRSDSLLVLTSGRVAAGQISQSVGGYVVDRPNGSFLIPFELVDFEAADLSDAHRRLRRRIDPPAAAAHVALARWCMNHDLFEEARQELRHALELEPNRLEARRMLVRLEDILRPAAPRPAADPEEPRRPRDGFEPPEVRSLAGLSRESATDFVARVQPLLVNKCGNAGCHGGESDNGFRLVHVRLAQRSHRVFAEQNLAAALEHVDFDQPDRSPLLVEPEGNHGRNGRPVFQGPAGAEQRELLREWVRQVVAEERPPVGPPPATASRKTASRKAAASGADPPELVFPGKRHAEEAEAEAGADAAPRDDDLLDAILREEKRDAFDPNEFNRAVHGRNVHGRRP